MYLQPDLLISFAFFMFGLGVTAGVCMVSIFFTFAGLK